MADGLIYHMKSEGKKSENLKIIYAWVSTGHFLKGMEIRWCKNWLSILAEREFPSVVAL